MKAGDRTQLDALTGARDRAYQLFTNLGLRNTFGIGAEERVKLDQEYEAARVDWQVSDLKLAQFQKELVRRACV
jgi:hypothetical protein